MEKYFWLIQRGFFVSNTRENEQSDLSFDTSIRLDYMGSAEFEWGAIPKAYRRLMHHFEEYETVHTGISSLDGDELVLFCNKDHTEEILRMVKEYIDSPYSLKEYSDLEEVPNSSKANSSYRSRRTDFWWCIDVEDYGDWMACMSSKEDVLVQTLREDYEQWWLTKPPEEREKEYNNSISWC